MYITLFDEEIHRIESEEELIGLCSIRDECACANIAIEKHTPLPREDGYSLPYLLILIREDRALVNIFEENGDMFVSNSETIGNQGISQFFTGKNRTGEIIEISSDCVVLASNALAAAIEFYETGGDRPRNIEWEEL